MPGFHTTGYENKVLSVPSAGLALVFIPKQHRETTDHKQATIAVLWGRTVLRRCLFCGSSCIVCPIGCGHRSRVFQQQPIPFFSIDGDAIQEWPNLLSPPSASSEKKIAEPRERF